MMSFFTSALLQSRSLVPSINFTQAFSLPPSQVWDGNDGAWSTFTIRVGNPPQSFRILPSTIGAETWVPIADSCAKGTAYCGNPRGVAPYNSASFGPFSGNPSGQILLSIDAGTTCTANKSPMCADCTSKDGKCVDGPCAGRLCCGDPAGACNSGGCNGVSGLCTGAYIGCPCPGPDWNAGFVGGASSSSANIPSPLASLGFMSNLSTTWLDKGTHNIGAQTTQTGQAKGQYGLDSVGLGPEASTGITIDSSIVAGIPALPFYLGHLGLTPSNSSGPGSNAASFMQLLANAGKIPSLSYGYTAGAIYRTQPSLGSLTLGGYDKNRFVQNPVTFSLSSTTLKVGIQSISIASAMNSAPTALSKPVQAFIDTTTPHTFLPASACQAFERAFGLTWDNDSQMYLINDTSHQQLINLNPTVTFTLAQNSTSPKVNISLPYSAFDLQAASPIFSKGTNYFPLRRASNDNQVVLGRAFFQEAYLIVDYEAKYFSISQTTFPYPNTTDIVTINHRQPASSAQMTSRSSLNPGMIAGIAIGSLSAIILLALIIFLLRRRRQSKNPATAAVTAARRGKISSPILHSKSSPLSTTSSNTSSYTARNSPMTMTISPNAHPFFANISPAEKARIWPHDNPPPHHELEDPATATALFPRNSPLTFHKVPPPLYTAHPTNQPHNSTTAAALAAAHRQSNKPLPPHPPQELPAEEWIEELMHSPASSGSPVGSRGPHPLSRTGSSTHTGQGTSTTTSPRCRAPSNPLRTPMGLRTADLDLGLGLRGGERMEDSPIGVFTRISASAGGSAGTSPRPGTGTGTGSIAPFSAFARTSSGSISTTSRRDRERDRERERERQRHIYEMMG